MGIAADECAADINITLVLEAPRILRCETKAELVTVTPEAAVVVYKSLSLGILTQEPETLQASPGLLQTLGQLLVDLQHGRQGRCCESCSMRRCLGKCSMGGREVLCKLQHGRQRGAVRAMT